MKLRCRKCNYSVAPRSFAPQRCPYCGENQLMKDDTAFSLNRELAQVN